MFSCECRMAISFSVLLQLLGCFTANKLVRSEKKLAIGDVEMTQPTPEAKAPKVAADELAEKPSAAGDSSISLQSISEQISSVCTQIRVIFDRLQEILQRMDAETEDKNDAAH